MIKMVRKEKGLGTVNNVKMKKIVLIFLFIGIYSQVISQAKNVKITENYTLSKFIVDSFNYKLANRLECKWEVFFVLIAMDNKRNIRDLSFSDSISIELKNELNRILYLSNGLWEKKYTKKIGRSTYLVLPVLKAFISNCKDTTTFDLNYKDIDRSIENELDLWKSVSIKSSRSLASILLSWEKLLLIGNSDLMYLRCVILPPCILQDKKNINPRKQ